MPLISVIMYLRSNERGKAADAVKSILSQTVSDFEFIIISHDNAELINSWNDPRIRYIDFSGSKAKALKRALLASHGELIARMEPRAVSLPTRFERQVDVLQSSIKTGLVGSWFELYDKDETKQIKPELTHEEILKGMLNANCFADGSVMFKKECAEAAGGYNASLRYFADYDLWLRIGLRYQLANIDSFLYKEKRKHSINADISSIASSLIGTEISIDRSFLLRRVNKTLHKFKRRRYHERDIHLYTCRQKERNNVRENFIEHTIEPFYVLRSNLAAYPRNDFLYYSFVKQVKHATMMAKTSPKKQPPKKEILSFIKMVSCVRYYYDAIYYNRLSESLEDEQRYLNFLCNLASLSNNPYQRDIYIKANNYTDKQFDIPVKTKDKYLVSVIMPTYNRANTISESIQSVLTQTLQDFELIIVNDGGSDNVEECIKSFNSEKIRYFKIEHSGLAAALNEGLKRATGKYIAYLDDDDIYYSGHLEKLHGLIETKKVEMVYAKSLLVNGRYEKDSFLKEEELGTYTKPFSTKRLHEECIISTLNVMHTRAALAQTGGFNEQLPWSMDWDMWVKFSEKFDIDFLDEFTGEYRVSGSSMTAKNTYKIMFYMGVLKKYYMSGSGLSTLLCSAYYNKDIESLTKYKKKFETKKLFLSKENVKKLLTIEGLPRNSRIASALFKNDKKLFILAVMSDRKLFFKYLFGFITNSKHNG